MPRKKRKSKPAVRGREKFGPPHPWRTCPLGKHWVRPHPRIGTRGVSGHCRSNRSHKDQIYLDELRKIANSEFPKLKGPPCPDGLGFPNGNKYDDLIRGWVKYWNEILQPMNPLDPDLVKALIGTESGFRENAKAFAGKREGYARGLMQVTDRTQKILSDEKGELKDHLIDVPQNKMEDPVANIAMGVRWLFRKKETTSSKLGRDVTWDEAIADYKGYLKDVLKGTEPRPMKDLRDFMKKLKQCAPGNS